MLHRLIVLTGSDYWYWWNSILIELRGSGLSSSHFFALERIKIISRLRHVGVVDTIMGHGLDVFNNWYK